MGIFTIGVKDISVTADATQDILSVVAGSTRRVRLLGFEVTSNATSISVISLDLHRISAVGSGGSALTVLNIDELADAATASVRQLDTTPGASVSNGIILATQWPQLGPWGMMWTPETALRSKLSQGFALGIFTATAFTGSAWITWEEV